MIRVLVYVLPETKEGWRTSISSTILEAPIVRLISRLRDEGRGHTTGPTGSANLADAELLWSLDGLAGAKAVRPVMAEVGQESSGQHTIDPDAAITIAIRQVKESIAAVPDPAIESAFDICL